MITKMNQTLTYKNNFQSILHLYNRFLSSSIFRPIIKFFKTMKIIRITFIFILESINLLKKKNK